jgi:hypothetical protein
VDGLNNNKAKVTMRKSYGFRTYRVLELALYHSLGKLPEPNPPTISSIENMHLHPFLLCSCTSVARWFGRRQMYGRLRP